MQGIRVSLVVRRARDRVRAGVRQRAGQADPMCPAPISTCQSQPDGEPSCPAGYRCTCVPSCPDCRDCAAQVCVAEPARAVSDGVRLFAWPDVRRRALRRRLRTGVLLRVGALPDRPAVPAPRRPSRSLRPAVPDGLRLRARARLLRRPVHRRLRPGVLLRGRPVPGRTAVPAPRRAPGSLRPGVRDAGLALRQPRWRRASRTASAPAARAAPAARTAAPASACRAAPRRRIAARPTAAAAQPGDRCQCVSSCPECDDCALSVCVPSCDPMCDRRQRISSKRIDRVRRPHPPVPQRRRLRPGRHRHRLPRHLRRLGEPALRGAREEADRLRRPALLRHLRVRRLRATGGPLRPPDRRVRRQRLHRRHSLAPLCPQILLVGTGRRSTVQS